MIVYILLAIPLILSIFNVIIYRKKYNLFKLCMVAILDLLYLLFVFKIVDEKYLIYYEYFLIALVVLVSIDFRMKVKITKNITEFDYFELETDFDNLKIDYENLRQKFVNSIDLMVEGVIFYENGKKNIILSSNATNMLELSKSEYTYSEYVELIDKSDVELYESTISKVSRKLPNYKLKYRILVNNEPLWFEETGRLTTDGKNESIIATLKGIDLKLFPETSIHEIDSVPVESKMVPILTEYTENHTPFYLVMLHLTNIPAINKKYGRDVGNIMIAEYIRKMRMNYSKNVNTIFRISGIQFAVIITDKNRYMELHRVLVNGGEALNIPLSVTSSKDMITPNLGIVEYNGTRNITADEIIAIANKSLDEAINSNKKNYSIFGE